MENLIEIFKNEFYSCIARIIDKPTAIDVDYNFYRMDELTNALREYVSKVQTGHNGEERQ